MSETTEQVAAEVLAEHESLLGSDDYTHCVCGEQTGTLGGLRAHVASVLAARLDDGLAAKVRELAEKVELNARSDRNDQRTDTELSMYWEGRADALFDALEDIRALLDQPHTGTNP